MSAVAGTTTSASIDCATAMCSMAESMFGVCSSPSENIPVMTFSPERAAKVRGRTNSWAALVMTTCTRMPRSCSRRTISAALYAAIPPVTPRAIFMTVLIADFRWLIQNPQLQKQVLVLPQRLIQSLFGLLGSGAGFGNLPLHLAGANFILRDAAGLAGIGVDHGRGAGLELPRAPCRHQNVSVVAVKTFDQLHGSSPLITSFRSLNADCRSRCFAEPDQLLPTRWFLLVPPATPTLASLEMIPRKLRTCRG